MTRQARESRPRLQPAPPEVDDSSLDYVVELCEVSRREIIGRTGELAVARAMFSAAVRERPPSALVLLRHGAKVIQRSQG